MKKIFTILTALCLAGAMSTKAQDYSSLLLNLDPASLAKGSTSFVTSAGAYLAGQNAAAMSLSDKKMSIGAGYCLLPEKIGGGNAASLGTYYKTKSGFAFGLGANYMASAQISGAGEGGAPLESFKSSDINAHLGLSYRIVKGLSLGVSAKFVHSALTPSLSSIAFGADVNLAYRYKGLSAALGVANLGSKLKYGESEVSLPAMARLGLAYSVFGLQVSAEVDQLFSGGTMAGAGLEYNLLDILFFRAGYHFSSPTKAAGASFASVGLGARFAGIELNVSYLLASESMAGMLAFGLGYSF